MKTNIKATNIKLSPNIKEYINEKMNMLDKYLGNIQVLNCDVEISMASSSRKDGKIYRAEVNLSVPRDLLRVEKKEKDLYKAIDKVKDHLQRSIKRYKEKLIDKKRKSSQ